MLAGNNPAPGQHDGFSLIECMVAIAIVGIMVSLAVPSFAEYARNSEMGAVTNALVSSMSSAKSHSMTSGRSATVAPTDGTSWSKGWTVFVDENRNGALDTSEKVISSTGAVPSSITIEDIGSSKGSVLFDAVGFTRDLSGGFTSRTLQVKRLDAATEPLKQRRVKISSSGRIRSCKPTSDTDPDCSVSGL